MPQVPRYPRGRITTAPLQGTRISSRVSPAGGEAIGSGLTSLGKSVDQIYREEKHKADEAAVSDSRKELLDFETSQNEWLYKQKGGNVVGAQDKVREETDKFVGELSSKMINPEQKAAFHKVQNEWRASFDRQTMRYVIGEMDRHYDDVDTQSVAASNRAAQKAATTSDFVRVQQEWDNQEKVLNSFADRKGYDKTQRDNLHASRKSNFHTGVSVQLISDGKFNTAEQYFKANKAEFDSDDSLKVQNLLKAEREKVSSELRITLSEKLQDLNAMALKGVTPPKGFINDADINTAFAKHPVRGEQFKREVKNAYRMAGDVSSLNNMSNQELVDFVQNKRAPNLSDPGNFAEDAQRQQQLGVMAASIVKQRFEDPLGYASAHNIGAVNPIDMTQPQNMIPELKNREATAKQMRDRFGSPLQLLTKEEASGLAGAMEQMPSSQRVEYLKSIYTGVKDPNAYHSIMQQIRPDSPVTSFAGGLMGKQTKLRESDPMLAKIFEFDDPKAGGRDTSRRLMIKSRFFGSDEFIGPQDVASRIIEGEAILNPTKGDKATDGKPKFAMPPDQQLRQHWSDYVRDAYRGAPNVELTSYQAFRAFYAAEAARQGRYDGNLSPDIAKQAAIAVSGGVADFNGKNVVLPWGMNRDEFHGKLKTAWPGIVKAYGLPANLPFDRVGFDTIGDGRYAVTAGAGPLYGKNGEVVIFEVPQ